MNESTITEVGDHKRTSSSSFLLKKGLLVVLSENFFGQTYVLHKNKNVIGRSRYADFPINDTLISSEHCRITITEDDSFLIEDLESRNFTFLNGRQLKKQRELHYGDKITIGNTIMRFYLEEEVNKR